MYFTGYWDRAMAGEESVLDIILLGVLGLVIYLVLNGYLLAKHGQTIGKRVVGTRIVSIDTNEILALWRVFFVRYVPQTLVAHLPLIGGFMLITSYLFIFRKDKRCVHDLIAKTKVVKAD